MFHDTDENLFFPGNKSILLERHVNCDGFLPWYLLEVKVLLFLSGIIT